MSGFALLASLNAPDGSGNFDFTGLSLGSVKVLRIIGGGLVVNASARPFMQVSVSGSFLTGASDYTWGACNVLSTSGSNNNDGDAADSFWALTSDDTDWRIGTGSGRSGGFEVYIDRPGSSLIKRMVGRSWVVGPTSQGHIHPLLGRLLASGGTGAIDGIRVGGSLITAGVVRLYTLS